MDLDQTPSARGRTPRRSSPLRWRGADRNRASGAGPLEIVAREPAVERVSELSRTLVCVLAATFTTAVGVSLAGWGDSVVGWALLSVSALAGLSPLAWYRRQARRSGRLPVWELDARTARMVAAAAEEAMVLRRLASRAPAGPVADHLDGLATTAHGYVVALHQAAVQSGVAARHQRDPELEAAMTRIVAQLADLSAAAGRLREAQRRHLQDSPLEQLTEATNRLAAALEQGSPIDR